MTEPKRPGLDEAIEAAAVASAGGSGVWVRMRPEIRIEYLDHVRANVHAAYEIIAAAVRDDERANWETRLDKVRALLEEADRWHTYSPREMGDAYAADTVLGFLADIRAAVTEPTP